MTTRKWRLTTAAAVLLLSTLACSFSATPTPAPTPTHVPATTPALVVATPTTISAVTFAEANADDLLLINLYERANPGVVNIDVAAGTGGEADPFGSGSGFLIDNEGHIVTNHHVIERADTIWITFSDGTLSQAEIVGADPDSDLAVLLVAEMPPGAVPLEMGNSDTLAVGQQVVAIGNPFGLEGTMTTGIVSALGRTMGTRLTNSGGFFSNPAIIQTDAPINPGNSGGPLLDSHGRVIGVNTAIQTRSGVNAGVGFAVPVNTVTRIVPHLIAEGFYRYPYLGITSHSRFSVAQLAPELDLPTSHGVLVQSVEPRGPADQAGVLGGSTEVVVLGDTIRTGGDIIVAIDGHTIHDFADLITYLVMETEVGQTVILTVLRDGEEMELSVELGERPR